MQKTELWPKINNFLGIVATYKIHPRLVTRKFRQNRRQKLFHEIYAEIEIMAQNQ